MPGVRRTPEEEAEFVNGAMLQVFDGEPAARELLAALLQAPTLYDEFLRFLARTGLDVPEVVLTRDAREPWRFEAGLVPVFRRIYEPAESPWGVYEGFMRRALDLTFIPERTPSAPRSAPDRGGSGGARPTPTGRLARRGAAPVPGEG